MDILGELNKENVEKTIDSVSYFLAQVDKLPGEVKIELIKLAAQQGVSFVITLNKIKLLFRKLKNNNITLSSNERILLSSLTAQNRLEYEKEIVRLKKEGKDIDLQFFMGLRNHIKG